MLCENKAPWIKRQVASIDKKSDFRAKSGPFRTSTLHTGSNSQEETDNVKDGHFRKGPHSKSKRAEFRGCQNTRRKKLIRQELVVMLMSARRSSTPRGAICINWKGAKDIKNW